MTSDRRDEEIRRALEAIAPALDRFEVPADAPDALVEHTMRRARGPLLAPARLPHESASLLPSGFGRELARLLAVTTPVAIASALSAVFFWEQLPGLLGALLPASIATGATGAWALGAATLASLTYGSLPFFAHHRAISKLEEVPS